MTIVPHDCGARVSGRQRVAGMTVVLGDPLFSSDFYCPLYPSIYRSLLRAWQEYHTQRGWQTVIFPSKGCRFVFGSHPPLPSPRVGLRPQRAPGALVGEGRLPEIRPSSNICTMEIGKCYKLELFTNPSSTPTPLPQGTVC